MSQDPTWFGFAATGSSLTLAGGLPSSLVDLADVLGLTVTAEGVVVTDAAPIYPGVLEELLPAVWHHVEQHANNPIEADHSQLKHRLRPMRGLRTDQTAQVIIAGHEFMQNLRRGHYEIAVDVPRSDRFTMAFTELALAI